jgi:hypothetical protein
VLLSLVLGGALALRLWRLDLAQVWNDEASAASLVAAWRLEGLFPLTGVVSSVGMVHTPGWPYVLALGLVASNTPHVLLAVGIAFGFLAVVLCWWVGRRWLGPWGGLATATFYGAGFYPVLLGRTAWQPAFLPALTLLCLDALMMLAIARQPWALVAACSWLALMSQFHWVAALYVLMLPVAMWPARRVLRPIHLVAGAAAALLGVLPFLLYELHPDVRLRDVTYLLFAQADTDTRFDFAILDFFWVLSSNGGAIGLGAPSEAGLREAFGRWSSATMIGPLLVAGGLLCAVLWQPRGWRGWLIVGWLLLPVAALARHTLDRQLHHMYLNLPVLALSAGVLAATVAASGRTILRAGFAMALVVYIAASVGSLWVLLSYADRADVHKAYRIPLRDTVRAGQVARALLPSGGQALVAGDHAGGEIFRFTMGYETPSRIFDDCREVPHVPGAVYLLTSEHTPGAAILPESGAPLLARIERPGDDFLVYGAPIEPPDLQGLEQRPEYESRVCQDRRAQERIYPAPRIRRQQMIAAVSRG